MVVQEQTLYAVVAVVALLATIVALALGRRFEGKARRHAAPMVVALGLLAVGYAIMALDLLVLFTSEGEPVYLSRFAVYTLTYTFIMSYVGLVAGAGLRFRLLPGIATLGFTYGTLVVQLAPPPLDSLGSLVVLVSLTAVLWAFFGPLTRAAQQVSGNRRLLFAKLRNLGTLVFIAYMLLALMTRQALGLFDAFVGVFVAAYVDLLAHVGLVGLILYSRETIAELAVEYDSPFATFRSGPGGSVESSTEESPADD